MSTKPASLGLSGSAWLHKGLSQARSLCEANTAGSGLAQAWAGSALLGFRLEAEQGTSLFITQFHIVPASAVYSRAMLCMRSGASVKSRGDFYGLLTF